MSECVYSYPMGHTYRSPMEIARDLSEISHRLNKMEEKLCIRDLLVEMLYRTDSPDASVIGTLEGLLADTKDALARMVGLRESLAMLEEELEVCRCHRV